MRYVDASKRFNKSGGPTNIIPVIGHKDDFDNLKNVFSENDLKVLRFVTEPRDLHGLKFDRILVLDVLTKEARDLIYLATTGQSPW